MHYLHFILIKSSDVHRIDKRISHHLTKSSPQLSVPSLPKDTRRQQRAFDHQTNRTKTKAPKEATPRRGVQNVDLFVFVLAGSCLIASAFICGMKGSSPWLVSRTCLHTAGHRAGGGEPSVCPRPRAQHSVLSSLTIPMHLGQAGRSFTGLQVPCFC